MHVELDVIDPLYLLDDRPHQLEDDIVEDVDVPVGFLAHILPDVQQVLQGNRTVKCKDIQ